MGEHMDADLRQGAKAAAAAAAVGAAVGVVRALASRSDDHADDTDDATEPERHDDATEPQDLQQEPEQEEQQEQEQQEQEERQEPEPQRGAGVDRLRDVTESARALLQELSGADVEAVSALDRTPAGWRVTLEAVELRRIPDSTDVLATYEVELDGDGDLVRYERRRRYSRSQSDHGDDR